MVGVPVLSDCHSVLCCTVLYCHVWNEGAGESSRGSDEAIKVRGIATDAIKDGGIATRIPLTHLKFTNLPVKNGL